MIGVETDLEKIQKVQECPTLTSLEAILDIIGNLSRFSRQWLDPSRQLIPSPKKPKYRSISTEGSIGDQNKKKHLVNWRNVCLLSLEISNYTLPFELHIDASHCGLGLCYIKGNIWELYHMAAMDLLWTKPYTQLGIACNQVDSDKKMYGLSLWSKVFNSNRQ